MKLQATYPLFWIIFIFFTIYNLHIGYYFFTIFIYSFHTIHYVTSYYFISLYSYSLPSRVYVVIVLNRLWGRLLMLLISRVFRGPISNNWPSNRTKFFKVFKFLNDNPYFPFLNCGLPQTRRELCRRLHIC